MNFVALTTTNTLTMASGHRITQPQQYIPEEKKTHQGNYRIKKEKTEKHIDKFASLAPYFANFSREYACKSTVFHFSQLIDFMSHIFHIPSIQCTRRVSCSDSPCQCTWQRNFRHKSSNTKCLHWHFSLPKMCMPWANFWLVFCCLLPFCAFYSFLALICEYMQIL